MDDLHKTDGTQMSLDR